MIKLPIKYSNKVFQNLLSLLEHCLWNNAYIYCFKRVSNIPESIFLLFEIFEKNIKTVIEGKFMILWGYIVYLANNLQIIQIQIWSRLWEKIAECVGLLWDLVVVKSDFHCLPTIIYPEYISLHSESLACSFLCFANFYNKKYFYYHLLL